MIERQILELPLTPEYWSLAARVASIHLDRKEEYARRNPRELSKLRDPDEALRVATDGLVCELALQKQYVRDAAWNAYNEDTTLADVGDKYEVRSYNSMTNERLVGFKMTLAKLSLFCEADGYDVDEGTPLIRITKGEPRPLRMAVRLATGVPDVCDRPIWDEWEATVRMRFDNDVFSLTDVTNLMARVGTQVGICEGRPDSKQSAGMGWGLFKIDEVIHD